MRYKFIMRYKCPRDNANASLEAELLGKKFFIKVLLVNVNLIARWDNTKLKLNLHFLFFYSAINFLRFKSRKTYPSAGTDA